MFTAPACAIISFTKLLFSGGKYGLRANLIEYLERFVVFIFDCKGGHFTTRIADNFMRFIGAAQKIA